MSCSMFYKMYINIALCAICSKCQHMTDPYIHLGAYEYMNALLL